MNQISSEYDEYLAYYGHLLKRPWWPDNYTSKIVLSLETELLPDIRIICKTGASAIPVLPEAWLYEGRFDALLAQDYSDTTKGYPALRDLSNEEVNILQLNLPTWRAKTNEFNRTLSWNHPKPLDLQW